MNFKISTGMFYPVIAGIFLTISVHVGAAERELFSETVEEGGVNQSYLSQHPEIQVAVDSGGNPMIHLLEPPLVEKSRASLEFNSGKYNEPTTLVVSGTHASNEKYGQIVVQLARTEPSSSWLELALLGPKGLDGKGIVFKWDPNDFFRYQTATEEKITPATYPTDRLHTITINYDLDSSTYEVWFNDEKLFDGLPFKSEDLAQGPTGVALSATWWGKPGTGSYITEWHWKASDQAFVGAYKPTN